MSNLKEQLKQGVIYTYSIPQSSVSYQLRLTNCAKGVWMCIQQGASVWKLTISPQLLQQTISKASSNKQFLSYNEFCVNLLSAIRRQSPNWTVGIMTPIQLQLLRGGDASKQTSNTKLYLILSDKENKCHYPFTFLMNEIDERSKIIQAIKSMAAKLEELRTEKSDKSMLNALDDTTFNEKQQLQLSNEALKKQIVIYQESIVQKRGAVEIDMILKDKHMLGIQVESKKREEIKEINRVKNNYGVMERETNQIRSQVQAINKELMLIQDNVNNSNKLRSHAMRVLKSYETELRNVKKVHQRQMKEIENVKRNINTSKMNERKVNGKIKQIQTEIEQMRKKTNIKQISNRLHSVGKNSVDSSSKAQSFASSTNKSPSSMKGNLVRDSLLKKQPQSLHPKTNSKLLKTTSHLQKTPNPPLPNDYTRIITAQGPNKGYGTAQFIKKPYSSGKSEQSSVKSEKKILTPEERERQKNAMERLAGRAKEVNRNPIPRKVEEKKEKVVVRGTSQKHFGYNQSNNAKAKDILGKIKEVKQHYNRQANNAVVNNRNIANRVAELKKEI